MASRRRSVDLTRDWARSSSRTLALTLSARSQVEVTLERTWSESAFTMSRTWEDLRRARSCLSRSERWERRLSRSRSRDRW
ncbi:hypothetical protein ACFX1W_041188 [Malus domestica]